MKYVGPHVSTGGGVEQAPLNATAIGARGFGMFTRNQRQWHAAPYTEANMSGFAANLAAGGYTAAQVLPHAGYLINLANPDEEAYAKSVAALLDETRRCAALGLDRLNLHPGSHLNKLEPAQALERVAQAINQVLHETRGVTIVIENTAGQGACLGRTFEELAALIRGVDDPTRVGICLDTAHLFAAGFDLSTRAGYESTLADFDRIVGRRWLRGIHLNDSKVPCGSHVDRHACLGDGHLGWKPFEWVMNDPRFEGLPLILETPDEERWPEEIKRLYALVR